MTEIVEKKTELPKTRKMPIRLIIILVFFLVILPMAILADLAFKFFLGKVKVTNCQVLTPLFLSEIEDAVMIKPIYGEKCDLGGNNFILRIAYKDETEAANAAFGLRIASPGEIRTESYIMDGTDAAAFYSQGNQAYIVVMPDIGQGKKVENFLKKVSPKAVLAGFSIPSADSTDINSVKDEILEKAKEEANKPTATPPPPTPTIVPTKVQEKQEEQVEEAGNEEAEILAAAEAYVKKYTAPDLKYTLSLRKIVGNYAMVDVTPEPGTADPAAVILQKIGGSWVAVDMGTIFPEWEEKVPELFR